MGKLQPRPKAWLCLASFTYVFSTIQRAAHTADFPDTADTHRLHKEARQHRHKAIQIKQTHNGTYGLALNLIEC